MLRFNAFAHPGISPSLVNNIDDLVHYGADNSKNKLVYQDSEISRYEITVDKHTYEYDFNQYGFRNKWNLDNNKPNIGFFGCSFTLGEFVAQDKIFSTLVASQTGHNGFNFGLSGAGIERTAQVFAAANRVINLEYAVITLPDWHRILYLNNDTNGIRYLNLIHTSNYNKKIDEIRKILYSLENEYFIHQAIRNINWIIDVAEKYSVKILLSSWEDSTSKLIDDVFPAYSIGRYEMHDRSLDQIHPGPVSHENYAKKIIKYISAN